MTVSPECQHYLNDKAQLEAERRLVWADIQQAMADRDLREKWRLAKVATDLTRSIDAVQVLYERCEINAQGLKPLHAVFTGTGEFTTSVEVVTVHEIDRKFPFTIPLYFDARRTSVGVTDFTPIPIHEQTSHYEVTGDVHLEGNSANGHTVLAACLFPQSSYSTSLSITALHSIAICQWCSQRQAHPASPCNQMDRLD